jgi:plastocyanin
MTRRPLLAALALTASLAIAACSGGGSTGAPSSAATDAPASQAASEPPAAAGPCTPSSDAGTVAVSMSEFAFSPSTVEAAVGDVIEFTNSDAVPHTATLDDESCTTENIAGGSTGALVFTDAGSFPFFCKIHPDMKGTFEISAAAGVMDY